MTSFSWQELNMSITHDITKLRLFMDLRPVWEHYAEQTMYMLMNRVKWFSTDKLGLPIKHTIDKEHSTRYNVSSNDTKLSDFIIKKVRKYGYQTINGTIGDGISDLIEDKVSKFLHDFHAGKCVLQISERHYGDDFDVVIADGSGNLIKVDVRLSAWYFESEQMKGVMRNVVSAAVVASTIDINKIDENAIRRMVRDGCRPDKQWEVLDKILEGRNVTSKHQQ